MSRNEAVARSTICPRRGTRISHCFCTNGRKVYSDAIEEVSHMAGRYRRTNSSFT